MGQKKLQQYYDQKLVGSYGGIAVLRRVLPDQDFERLLSEQDTYTLHKPVRRCFKRRCVVVGGPNQEWLDDLVDVSRLKKTNDGTALLLTVIDLFSKRAWCIPLKNKSAVSPVTAFAPLLGNKGPITLQTDKGPEFLKRALQKLLKEYACTTLRCTMKNEGKYRIKVQQNFEDQNVALFHKETIGSVRRRATGLYTIVQQHVSPHYWYGTVRGECNKPGRGLATPLRLRKCGNTEVPSR